MSGAPSAARSTRGIGLATAVAALGGLLFGYDTGIISAAQLYFPVSFGARPAAGGGFDWSVRLFGLVDLGATKTVEVVVACLLFGALAGALTGGVIADRFGRRPTLIGVALVFVAGAVSSGAAPAVEVLIVARVVLGYSIGVSSVVVPLYIAEVAPADRRGRLVSMNQFMITVGIFVSYLVGFALGPSSSWRAMLVLAAVPAAVMLVGLTRVSESPRWLAVHGRASQAREVLMRTRSAEQAETELYEIAEHAKVEQSRRWADLLTPRMRPALLLGIGMAFINQMVGVNALIYYTPTILGGIYGSQVALGITVLVGLVNMVVTFVALNRIDHWGRRPLIVGGTAVVTGALIVLALLFLAVPSHPTGGNDRPALGITVGLVGALCVYIAAFAASLGLGIWLINSEVYPTAIRGKASGLGSTTHWVLDLIISLNVLTLIAAVSPTGLFGIFAVFGVAGLVLLWRGLPETKGQSLEHITAELQGRLGSGREG